MQTGQTNPVVDATIRQYLTDKVREKFPEDYHLIEPLMTEMVSQYSIKELFIRCSIEISRIKNKYPRTHGSRESSF